MNDLVLSVACKARNDGAASVKGGADPNDPVPAEAEPEFAGYAAVTWQVDGATQKIPDAWRLVIRPR